MEPLRSADALETILAARRPRVDEDKRREPLAELKARIKPRARPSLAAALRRPGLSLIAELKSASPSRGDIRPAADCREIVRLYEEAGASAISVLTEPSYFDGSFSNLSAAREVTNLPLLCKDFIFDPYQIYQAAAAGADAVLLIVTALSPAEQSHLINVAKELGLEVLLEATSAEELDQALAGQADVLGINNRNLRTLEVNLNLSLELAPRVRDTQPGARGARPVISESGIFHRADALKLEKCGVDGILVGTALMESPDIKGKIAELMGWELSTKE